MEWQSVINIFVKYIKDVNDSKYLENIIPNHLLKVTTIFYKWKGNIRWSVWRWSRDTICSCTKYVTCRGHVSVCKSEVYIVYPQNNKLILPNTRHVFIIIILYKGYNMRMKNIHKELDTTLARRERSFFYSIVYALCSQYIIFIYYALYYFSVCVYKLSHVVICLYIYLLSVNYLIYNRQCFIWK